MLGGGNNSSSDDDNPPVENPDDTNKPDDSNNPGGGDDGNVEPKIELPGISFSDTSAKSMVSNDGYGDFEIQDGYLVITRADTYPSFKITYPSSQNLTNKKIKITGHLADDCEDGSGPLMFHVGDGTSVMFKKPWESEEKLQSKEYVYGLGGDEKFTLSKGEDSTITSKIVYASLDESNLPDITKITILRIYSNGGSGKAYIKSIEFVD